MFLLNEEEKINFLKIIYTAAMYDKKIIDAEEKIIRSIQEEIFNISSFERIDLDIRNVKTIAEIIDKIDSIIPVIYLFNILYEMAKFTEKRNDYIQKINIILNSVKMRDKIINSSIFEYKKYLNEKDIKNKNEMEEIVEETVDKVKNLINKFKFIK